MREQRLPQMLLQQHLAARLVVSPTVSQSITIHYAPIVLQVIICDKIGTHKWVSNAHAKYAHCKEKSHPCFLLIIFALFRESEWYKDLNTLNQLLVDKNIISKLEINKVCQKWIKKVQVFEHQPRTPSFYRYSILCGQMITAGKAILDDARPCVINDYAFHSWVSLFSFS